MAIWRVYTEKDVVVGEAQDPRDVLMAWMADRGCTIQWLADRIGYTRAMLSRVLNKHKPMSKRMARDLHDKLDIPVTWIPNQPVAESRENPKTAPVKK